MLVCTTISRTPLRAVELELLPHRKLARRVTAQVLMLALHLGASPRLLALSAPLARAEVLGSGAEALEALAGRRLLEPLDRGESLLPACAAASKPQRHPR